MSDLLNKASLVVIPSGYKEDTVYSVVPTDGSGDLSFTRASNGTRINSAGLVEVCPWNLLQYSEQIDNGVWTKFSPTSVTADTTTAPNGTATADTISTSATAVIRQSVTLNANETYTYSIYVKKISYDFFGFQSLISGTGVKSVFDLSNGTVTSQGSGHTASIESVGNGWYRCIITFNVGSSASNIFDLAADGTSSTLRTFYAWGAQTNIGATAKPYFPTTDRLNVPRLTYQNGGGGCPSLLLEKQSTNLALYSEQFDNASWIKLNGSVTANIAVSPDGTQNADSFIPNTTSGIHALRSNLFNQSATASHSWFVKANGYTKIAVRESELVGNYATFNLTTGTLISTNQTGSIQNLGNGWYRCTLVDTTTGVNAQTSIVVLPDSYTSGDPIVVNWSGDGTSGVYVFGAQIEVGSYATSYIPTTSSSATRVADVCSKTDISSLIGQTEGVIFVDFDFNAKFSSSGVIPISANNPSVSGNVCYIFVTTSNDLLIEMSNSSGVQCSIIGSIGAVGRKKIAFAYKQNDFVVYMNGTQIGTDTSGSVVALSRLRVGGYLTSTDFDLNSGINQAILFPTRLSNAELASLTTI